VDRLSSFRPARGVTRVRGHGPENAISKPKGSSQSNRSKSSVINWLTFAQDRGVFHRPTACGRGAGGETVGGAMK
jgi:hypothetical protein